MANARLFLPLLGIGLFVASAPGCSSDAPAVPQAYVDAFVGPSADDPKSNTQACNLGAGVHWCDIEQPNAEGGTGGPVADGSNVNGAAVSVSCKVIGNDQAGYDVAVSAELAGFGSMSFSGHFTTDTAPQGNISASWGSSTVQGYGTFSSNTCNVTLGAGIAAGRIGGTIDCVEASNTQQTPAKVCDAHAVFTFENCAK